MLPRWLTDILHGHLHRHVVAAAPAAGETAGAQDDASARSRRKDKAYVSDFTRFMDSFLEQHPEVVEDQHRGWWMYWNHPVDFDDQRHAGEDTVPPDPYYYFPVSLPTAETHSPETGRTIGTKDKEA